MTSRSTNENNEAVEQIRRHSSDYVFRDRREESVAGCAVGLPLSKYMYDFLITAHFFYASWCVPVGQMILIVSFVLASSAAAVYAPAKRLYAMEITETINEL